ncbi:GNAT superfamily N-acetyltransferase [Bacillus fengqiuensis]|nr:GNAT superfamily N-acetyltransferase [Bacillus fengqiuensis]
MEFQTVDYWNDALWQKAESIYHQTFKQGAKKEQIIRRLFERQRCFLHVAIDNDKAVAMALTGKLESINALLIDYLAVREDIRRQGVGQKLMDYIKNWAATEEKVDSLIIEVEAEINETNLNRIRFWEKAGFQLTDYVHQYIWVPEPYRAMYLKINPAKTLPTEGKRLFNYITQFHRAAYKGK